MECSGGVPSSPNQSMSSPTSVAGSHPPELAAKYSKLASEYSKLRAQLGVLKRAVLDEQAKNVELEDTLKDRDQAIRKSEAEMDSLTFRNQQLARRVEVLQEDGEVKVSKAKNHLNDADRVAASESLNSVMSEELQLKIAENAKLHAALDGVDKRYEDRISALQSKVNELESLASKKAQAERAEDTRLKDLVQGLKVNNSDLTNQIQSLEKDLSDKNDKITVLQVQLESASEDSQKHSIPSTPKVALAPPLTSTDAHIQTVELLSQLGENVQDIVAGLSDLHTYWEHRLKDIYRHKPWTDTATRLSQLLLQNVKHLKPIEQSYQDVLSDLLSSKISSSSSVFERFVEFSLSFSSYVKYAVDDVEPLLISSIQQDSKHDKNSQLQSEIRAFNRVLERLRSHLDCLTEKEEDRLDSVENITVALSQLHQQGQEFLIVYRTIAADEEELPTVPTQLKNTNQCIVAALSNLVSSLNALSRNLSDNLPRIGGLISAVYEPPAKEDDEDKEEMKSTTRSDVSAEEDVLKETITNLQQEIGTLNDRLKKAEQKKEHWKLEYQLVQMKYDKCKGDDATGSDFSEDKSVYEERIDQLVAEKLAADSKASHFYLECSGLLKQVKLKEKERLKAQEKLQIAEEQIDSLKGDVDSTASNYESQLKIMTEHVANMNDKLADKTERIEKLQFELNTKK